MVHFRDALCGVPTSWVSPSHSSSPDPSSTKNKPPTSLWKGEGRYGWGRASSSLEFVVEPTYLNIGEGLMLALLCVVEKEGGAEEGRWWWRNERGRPNINRDAVDLRFKLRSPSKIVFDMNARLFDKKIKVTLC